MIAGAEAAGSGAFLCDSYGGAIGRVGAAQTAFVHRGPLFCIQYYSGRRDHRLGATGMDEDAPVRIRQGLPELHRPGPAGLGAGVLRRQPRPAEVDPHSASTRDHYFNFPQAIGR